MFIAELVVSFIIMTAILFMGMETFSFILEARQFKSTAKLAARVASSEVTQYAIRRTSGTTVDNYYQQKLDSAEGAYGLAQVQDGFIVVDTDIFSENGRYAGAELPVGNRYIDYLRNNMETLISRFGFDEDGNPRYSPDDGSLKIEYLDSVYGDLSKKETENSSDAYKYGTASRRYKVSIKYKPRYPISKTIMSFMQDIYITAVVQPINYIEP